MPRKITLHVFASAKGGVGKSSLAVACAKLIAQGRDRLPVVIDADMTGTSLADGMRLLAPDATLRSDGTIDIEAGPTGRFLPLDEVKRRRRLRRDSRDKRGLPPPFLNDALRPFLEEKAEDSKDLTNRQPAVASRSRQQRLVPAVLRASERPRGEPAVVRRRPV